MLRSRFAPLLVAALLAAPFAHAEAEPAKPSDGAHAAAPAAEDFSRHVPGAAEIEGRIIAPCCWNQTIDIHGSESSNALRREIRRRLREGESKDSIVDSMVERYGQKILAVPSGSRLGSTGVFLAITMGVAGVGAIALLRRWQRRSSEDPNKGSPEGGEADPKQREALDARIDAELARLDRE